MIAVSVALTGAADSPALMWLGLPAVTLGARFELRGSRQVFAGQVVQLLGSAEQEQGTLIAPGVLDNASEPGVFRAVLSFPELARSLADACRVGQSGEVTFD